jgi:murein DD-endopeptidase MepM/ murein hydrolase activator NlpD
MNDDVKDILNIYKSILDNRKNINEAPLSAPIPILGVNSKFNEKRSYEKHPGVDLKAKSGTEIKSPADGIVIDAKDDSRRCGGTIFIDHQNGFKSRYCHVKDVKVNKNDKVSKGDIVGLSGGSSGDKGKGNSMGAHLHFELYKDGKLVDPMQYIGTQVATTDNDDNELSVSKDYKSSEKKSYDINSIGDEIMNDFIKKLTSSIGMGESKTEKEILNSFGLILRNNKSFLNEISSSSDSLFGGSSVNIPVDGAHAGQSGWQSNNAWDIKASIGSPVYALADGVAETFSDYGKNIIKKQGKKLYGQSFTVKSDGGLPKIYYTHLEGSPIKKGSTIKCGQLIGYVMDMPNSSYDHVHIGVESGHNIREFLNSDGTLKCGGKISGDESPNNFIPSSSSEENDFDSFEERSSSDASTNIGNSIMKNFIDKLTSIVQESKIYSDFGKEIKNSSGSFILPKDRNKIIYSPVSGKINNIKINLRCKNQITLYHNVDGKEYHLEFCGISNLYVKNKESVSQGDILGKTNEDVIVTLFDEKWKKVDLKNASKYESSSENNSEKNKKDKKKDKDDDKIKKPITPYRSKSGYQDPAVDFFGSILTYPFRFKEKEIEDKSKISKLSSPTSKNQPDPGFLINMFKEKKVNENIERIKKLLDHFK